MTYSKLKKEHKITIMLCFNKWEQCKNIKLKMKIKLQITKIEKKWQYMININGNEFCVMEQFNGTEFSK